MSATCISDLRLDELLAGELTAADTAAITDHVTGCERCRDRERTLAADRAQFRAARPPLARTERSPEHRAHARGSGTSEASGRAKYNVPGGRMKYGLPGRRSRPWIAVAASGLAAAAAAVAIILGAPADATRLKGGARLAFVVAHGGPGERGAAMTVGGPGERVRPGDTLSYLVSAAQPHYVAVLGRDATGRIAPYFPLGDRAQWVPAGRDVQLPIATRLDDQLGPERLAGVFCDRPVALAELTAAVDGAPPEGCTVDRFDLEKVP